MLRDGAGISMKLGNQEQRAHAGHKGRGCNDAHDTCFHAGRDGPVAVRSTGIGGTLSVSDGAGLRAAATEPSPGHPHAVPVRESSRQSDVGRQGGDSQEECTDGEAQQDARAEQLSARRKNLEPVFSQ